MEILSGHQYVAKSQKTMAVLQIPLLVSCWFEWQGNAIASKDVEKCLHESGNYKTDKDGNFHIAKSYGPENIEGVRSRIIGQNHSWSKFVRLMKMMNTELSAPTNRSNKKFTWKMPCPPTKTTELFDLVVLFQTIKLVSWNKGMMV